jgi:flagellar basal body P-ring formation protein FlgA
MRLRLLPLLLLLAAAPATAEAPAGLIEELAREAFTLALPGSARIEVRFAEAVPEEVVLISEFRMNPNTGQFIADAVMPDGTTHRLAGLASPLVRVPVPVRALPPGSVLSEADIEEIELHAARVGALATLDISDLIGMQTRQSLSPGRPIMRQAVIPPLIIKRGETVGLRYQNGALSLTVSARAMSDAHAGQPVRVVNLASNALVHAVATGPGRAEVIGTATPDPASRTR